MRSAYPTKTLREVLRLEYGKPLPETDRTTEKCIPAFGANGVLCWSKKAFRNEPSIIVGRKGSAGEVNMTHGPFWPTDVTYFVEHDTKETDLRYLFYLLKFLDLPKLAKGVKPGINRNDVYTLRGAVPPLIEQRRIVAILDEAFEGISNVTANAEKNLAKVQELFSSALGNAFSSLEGCPIVLISEACEEIVDCLNRTAPKVDYETPYLMLRTTNVRNGKISLRSVNYVDEETFRIWTRRQVPQAGDVVLTREAPLGEVGIIEGDENVFLGQRLVSYRAHPKKIDSRYLLYCLRSQPLQAQIRKLGSGATVQHMRVPDSKALKIPLPSLNEQAKIVAQLDQISLNCDALARVYGQKLRSASDLRQSLLHEAFSGTLTSAKAVVATRAKLAVVNTHAPEFTADILAFAYSKHAAVRRERTLGRVKGQKLLHLVESVAIVDLGREPIKDAAGPNDSAHMRRAEQWAAENEYFTFVQRSGGVGYDFKKGKAFDRLFAGAHARLASHRDAVGRIIEIVVPMDSEEAEVLATVHAAWNNLLIDGIKPTRQAILHEARQNWTPSKLKIAEAKFETAIRFIRKNNLVPDGSAKPVRAKQESLF